jgi:uncharacterized protein (DUF2249 family)
MPKKHEVVVDITSTTPSMRKPLIDAILREAIASDAGDSLVIVYDHEPVGLGYELELRKDTRGRFDFSAMQRTDGCWVARLTPRSYKLGL